ncbi:MAG: glycosyltransferase [Clostridia bacterium]|nr:glycosyltransferase [Clostridia bacterium]
MKFSIVVPVYNVEKYLSKCLDSILNQTYKDFELLIVNDGSPDNSQDIIDDYKRKYPETIKCFIKENGGLSDARNYGIKRATGEYLVLVDSDDFIEPELLQEINEEIQKNPGIDIIGYHMKIVDEKYNITEVLEKPVCSNIDGQDAIQRLVLKKKFFEPAWGYVYRLDFWRENNFEYAKGMLHEDLGLTPEVIIKAKKVSIIDYAGYGYYQSDNSITRSATKKDISKEKKKAFDIIHHFDRLDNILKLGNYNKKAKKLLYSYLAGTIIWKLDNIPDEFKKEYLQEIRKRKLAKLIISNTIREKKYFIMYRLKYKI